MLKEAEDGGDPVREIRLPALAEKDDPLGREVGEALWSERYSREYLEHTRKVLGAYWFSAMYQGKPVPDEGGIFNRRDFRFFDVDEPGGVVTLRQKNGDELAVGLDWLRKFQVVDLAASEKQTADYTVMAEIWVTPENDMLIRDVVRDRIAVPDQPEFFRAHHKGGPVAFESIGYQAGMIQTMLRRGFPARPVYPDKDKVTRAGAAGAMYRAGKVYHLAGAEWLGDFEAELLAFPAGEHDDQVDAIAYAARDVATYEGDTRKKKQKEPGKTLTGGLLGKRL
jgi:predicted phage terminase large subunit-like protein